MVDATWEKPKNQPITLKKSGTERLKFLIGGLLILASVVYLIISGTAAGARYFITVESLLSNADYVGQTVRISGAVIGDTIEFVADEDSTTITFTMTNIPDTFDDLASTLHEAVNDPDAPRITVVVRNQPMPDLLQHEAQAIVSGYLGEDGIFYANELLLRCPSRYESDIPQQSANSDEA